MRRSSGAVASLKFRSRVIAGFTGFRVTALTVWRIHGTHNLALSSVESPSGLSAARVGRHGYSYKRVKGSSHTAEKRISMHPHAVTDEDVALARAHVVRVAST